MAEFTKVCFTTDEGEWNSLSSAESWQMYHNFNGINVVRDDNQFGFTFLNKSCYVIKTELDVNGLGSLAGTTLFSGSLKTELLLLLSLGRVL